MNSTKNHAVLKMLLCAAIIFVGNLSQSSISLAQGPWTTKSPMPTPKIRLSTSAVNGKIYAIGGWNVNKVLATVEEYDPTTDTWTTKTPMPTARVQLTTSTVNGKIYAIGGAKSPGEAGLSTVEEYDPVTNTWTAKTPMPTARTILSSSVVNGKIYVIGGWLGPSGSWVATVEEYDPVTDTWTQKTDMPTARWGLSTCAADDKIYAIGGANTSGGGFQGGLHTVEVYDPLTDTWESKADMPTRRVYFAASVVNGIIYAIGDNISILEAYNPVTDGWIKLADIPTARWGLSASTVNGKIYVIGGLTSSNWSDLPTAIVEEYDPHLDLLPLIEKIELDKSYAKPGTDSVCITTKISDPTGITVMAHFEAPNQTSVDSLQLFDDGNHNDEIAGDGLYANFWPVGSSEVLDYYVDLQVTRIDMDTVTNLFSNVARFITVGPVTIEGYLFASSDTVFDPGDRINIKLTLKNKDLATTAPNIEANLISLDTLVKVSAWSRTFGDLEPGESSTSDYYGITIDDRWSGNSQLLILVEISSNDYVYWKDTIIIPGITDIHTLDDPGAHPFKIYPNPTDNLLNIEINNSGNQGLKIEIFTITGELISWKEYKKDQAHLTEKLDLSGYAKGIYLVKVRQADTVYVGKVIVR